MSAVGAKAIVEIQFADYAWPGFNQLIVDLTKSCAELDTRAGRRVWWGRYLSLRRIEATLLIIRGIKVVYPSNARTNRRLE